MQDKTHETRDKVEQYYGETLQGSEDLKTNACCPIEGLPHFLKPYLEKIHPEISSRFYGCGSPIPFAISGKTIVDLGCGTGRDCYLLSPMVGESGKVIGIDMTQEQLTVARKHESWQMDVFNISKTNVEFFHGFIEELSFLQDNSVDVVISNCVINLSANKHAVFSEIYRVLKPGGELFFSDVFSDRRIPADIAEDTIMLGECLGGALYTEDFRRMMSATGFEDIRLLQSGEISLTDPQVKKMAGNIRFKSLTLRAFKLPLEDRCEDYGQVATYLGGIPFSEHLFQLDDHHIFELGKPVLVCGNTADMLSRTRYAEFFEVSERRQHFGLFDCGTEIAGDSASGSACC